MFDDPSAREAYRRGVHDALDSASGHHPAAHLRALRQWASDVDGWQSGEPPLPPHEWAGGADGE